MFPPIPASVLRFVIYPLYRGARRDALLEALEELESNQWLSRAELEDLKWQRIAKLLKESATYVPYYRDLFREISIRPEDIQGPADFGKLPFLTKQIIKTAGTSILSEDPLRRGVRSVTGGSSGEPLVFFVDISSAAIRRANALRGIRWAGIDLGERQAVFWGDRGKKSLRERLLSSLRNYFTNTVVFSTFDMSDEGMGRMSEKLRAFKPRLVTGYPSALALIASFIRSHRIQDIKPRAVIASGEELYESQRDIIEAVFGCRVFDRYGTREFSNVAHECEEHRGLHVMSDLFHVEVVTEGGRAAAEGELGEIVITDLTNFYMPFIRYKTGDLAVPTGRYCPCGRGFPLLDRIEGRSFDAVVTPDGRHIGGFFWNWLSGAVPGIRRLEVEQVEQSKIVLRFVPGPEWHDDYLRELEKKIRDHCGYGLSVTFEKTQSIALTSSGKARSIVSNLCERLVVKSKIHRATVTAEEPEAPDCIVIDHELMELADIAAHEKVLIVDMTNGARVDTFALPGKRGSGELISCGASSKQIRKGDIVGIMAFTWSDRPTGRFANILVDDKNRFARFLTEIPGEKI